MTENESSAPHKPSSLARVSHPCVKEGRVLGSEALPGAVGACFPPRPLCCSDGTTVQAAPLTLGPWRTDLGLVMGCFSRRRFSLPQSPFLGNHLPIFAQDYTPSASAHSCAQSMSLTDLLS